MTDFSATIVIHDLIASVNTKTGSSEAIVTNNWLVSNDKLNLP